MNKRDAAEKKALKYLYGENTEEVTLSIKNLHKKKEFPEHYRKDLEIFKKLFNSGDEDLRMAVWNAIWVFGSYLDRADFSEEEWDFLQKHCKAHEKWRSLNMNANPAISTERLILRPEVTKDPTASNLYHEHLREDGDFTMYSCRKPTRDNIRYYDNLSTPYCFVVYERETDRMVGMVELSRYNAQRRMASMKCYVFKPDREKGYGREAVLALAKRAFAGKLFELVDPTWDFLCKKRFAKIDMIRASIRSSNLPAQALARSCGFVHQYTRRRGCIVEGEGIEDAEVFELTPADLAAAEKGEKEGESE